MYAAGASTFLILCLSLMVNMGFAQKDYWALYPTKVDFAAGPPVFSPMNFSNPSPQLHTPYVQENSVYDTDGTLLFYYQDGTIFTAQGQSAGSNPYYIQSSSGEVVIMPLPGYCSKAYCILTVHTFPLVTLMITMQEVIANPDGTLYVSNVQILDNNMLFSNSAGIGASKIIPGTDADRFFYAAINSMGQVRRYRMSNAGLSFDGIAATFPGNNQRSSELEISPNGQLMAWSDGNTVYFRNISSFPSTNTSKIMEGPVNGLEFSHGSKFLLASVEGKGIAVISVTASPYNYSYIPGSDYFGNTYLEAAKDEKIYCVNGKNGVLYAIWPDLVTMTSTEVTVHSNGFSYMSNGYALPDQIDGESDDIFYGVPPLAIHQLSVDGLLLPEQTMTTVPVFYNCDNIDLAVNYSGSPTSHSVHIYSVDPVTGLQISGPPYLDYFGNFGGPPPAAIDLRCLDDPVACDMFNGYFGQTFAVEVSLKDRCGTTKQLGYFRVFDAPYGPADIDLRINAGNGPVCTASHNPATPCLAGVYSGAVSLSNSNGDITYYRITIDETHCTTGAVIQNLYNGPITAVSNVAALVFGFNSFVINGNTGYFANNAFLNRCIRVTAEVGNNCGSATDYSYVRFNGNYLIGDPGVENSLAGQQEVDKQSLSLVVFPNPVHDECRFRLSEPLSEDAELLISDITGRLALRINLVAGESEATISTAGLQPGAWLYRLHTSGTPSTGILIKQ